MGKMIPGQALIYERVDEVVYARYRDAPHNKKPRWVIGGNPKQMELFDHHDFNNMARASKHYPTLKKQLDKLRTIWYTIKDEAEKKITAE
tara:strand:- start:3295 stop:3564 length:270 start_codon:yes stop_codon:yes gene_type:complete